MKKVPAPQGPVSAVSHCARKLRAAGALLRATLRYGSLGSEFLTFHVLQLPSTFAFCIHFPRLILRTNISLLFYFMAIKQIIQTH